MSGTEEGEGLSSIWPRTKMSHCRGIGLKSKHTSPCPSRSSQHHLIQIESLQTRS
jgi:hypothetical protein